MNKPLEVYYCFEAQEMGFKDYLIWYMDHNNATMSNLYEISFEEALIDNTAKYNYIKFTTMPKNYIDRYAKIISFYE
jgi:hypothetical protein